MEPNPISREENGEGVVDFIDMVLKSKWEKVIKLYETNSDFHKTIIKGGGTTLHVAVVNGLDDIVKTLVTIVEKNDVSCLSIMDNIGATPLHLAAYRGFTNMCKFIIGKNNERKDLIRKVNKDGETPLFWAVLAHKKPTFVYLQQFYPDDIGLAINKDPTTILHIAIQREMFDLANIIMHCYASLSYIMDKDGVRPLQILATKTSAFKSGRRLSWWKKILYHCIPVSHDDAKTTMKLYQNCDASEENVKNEKDDHSGVPLPLYHDQFEKVQHTLYQVDFCCRVKILSHCIQKFVSGWEILSLLDLKAIKIAKKKHICGGQLLEEFMKQGSELYNGGENDIEHEDEKNETVTYLQNFTSTLTGSGYIRGKEPKHTKKMEGSTNNNEEDTTPSAVAKTGIVELMEHLNTQHEFDKKGFLLVAVKNVKKEEKYGLKDTVFLIAASHGIYEMMSKIVSKIKCVIHETNSNKENALLLAVKNRHPQVTQWLEKNIKSTIFNHLSLQVDQNHNTMLHLAAYASSKKENSWWISGAALQMMWDINWYKYIQGLVSENSKYICNDDGKTPSEVFKEEHKELLQKSVEWLKDTAESCSVVAALIAGVSFATSGSVPGGNKETGEPSFEGSPAFEGFAISSLVGLYFSVTALIMFLSILTSRKEIEDFHRSLPMKLLFGLFSLFISIVSMFISFCAGHFFVLTDNYTKGAVLFYLYVPILVPILFYAAVQFPLFVDLIMVIWRKVPPPSVTGVQM